MAWHLSPGAGLGGWKGGEVHECQVDSLSRHHIRQRMGQTGRAPRASQGDGARWWGNQGQPHPGGGLGSAPKEEEGLVCQEHDSDCWQSAGPRPRWGGCSSVGESAGNPGGVALGVLASVRRENILGSRIFFKDHLELVNPFGHEERSLEGESNSLLSGNNGTNYWALSGHRALCFMFLLH